MPSEIWVTDGEGCLVAFAEQVYGHNVHKYTLAQPAADKGAYSGIEVCEENGFTPFENKVRRAISHIVPDEVARPISTLVAGLNRAECEKLTTEKPDNAMVKRLDIAIKALEYYSGDIYHPNIEYVENIPACMSDPTVCMDAGKTARDALAILKGDRR